MKPIFLSSHFVKQDTDATFGKFSKNNCLCRALSTEVLVKHNLSSMYAMYFNCICLLYVNACRVKAFISASNYDDIRPRIIENSKKNKLLTLETTTRYKSIYYKIN